MSNLYEGNWVLDECKTVDYKTVRVCVIESQFIGTGTAPGAPIYNTTEIINNFLNCTTYPFQTVGNCADIVPGFCGSILQNINGAWDIFRSPGITEITVGNVAKPPGANFPDVASALGDSLVTNCRFIRITDNTTDGNLNIPNGTLIYIDPGVTWTAGTLTLNGDFILTGATNLNSSTFVYGGSGGTTIINGGGGNVLLSNLRIIHNGVNNDELLVDPTLPCRITNVYTEQNSLRSFLSDAGAPFQNMILDHVTIEATLPLVAPEFFIISQVTSRLKCNVVNLLGPATGLIIRCGTGTTPTWNGLVANIAGGTAILQLSGNISNFHDVSNLCSVDLFADSYFNQVIANTLTISGDNSIVQNAKIGTLDLTTSPSQNLQLTNITTANLFNDILDVRNNTKIVNFQYTSTNIITTPDTGGNNTVYIQNITLGSDWTISTLNGTTLYVNNCILPTSGILRYNIGVADTTGILNISKLQGQNIIYGNGIADNGNLRMVDIDIQTLTVNTSGTLILSNFNIRETNKAINSLNVTNSGVAKYLNGLISASVLFSNLVLNQFMADVEILGEVNLSTISSVFSNITCFANDLPGVANYYGLTISGNNNSFNNFQTHGLVNDMAGGTLLISGNNNTFNAFHLVGSSVSVTGVFNTLKNIRIQGCRLTVPSPPGAQSFLISGSQTKLSHIHLGASLIFDTTAGAGFTTDGFGSNVDGRYNISLGVGNTTRALQVTNLSIYPRRGQVVAPTPDITGVLSATQTFTIRASYSTYSNFRVWSYPGNGGLVIGHQLVAQTLFLDVFCVLSQFNNIIVGYGRETDVTSGVDIGTYDIQGPDNFHHNVSTFTITMGAGAVRNQFIGCQKRVGGAITIINAAPTICVGNVGFVGGVGATTGGAPIGTGSNQ